MQMWHLPAIFAPDFLLTFFGNSKFMQVHFFGSSHFRWYWRIYMLIPKKKASPSCGVKNVRSVPRILGQNNGNYDRKINGPLNSRTYTQSHTSTVVQGGGGGVDGTPLLGFWYVAIFRNDFAFIGKPLIFSTRWGIFYGWWLCLRSVTSPNMVIVLVTILDFIKS